MNFFFFRDSFLLLGFIVWPDDNCIYFPLKDGKDFGNWTWKEVGKLSSFETVECGTSS